MHTKSSYNVAFIVPVVKASLVLQWPIKGKHCYCVCRCRASQAACWRQFLNSGIPMGLLCATGISTPHILSTLFRQQVETHTFTQHTKWLSVSLSICLSHLPLYCLVVCLQRQASSGSSVASQRSFSNCFLSTHSRTLRAQLVCHNRLIFFDH